MARILTGNTIEFDTPAQEWHEALPLGSGRLGAMVYGGINTEILAINEDTLWCGAPETEENATKPSDRNWTKEASRLAAERKYVEAHDYVFDALAASKDIGPYSFFGELKMDIVNSNDGGSAEVTGYRRLLDMRTAIAVTEYTQNKNRIVRECYVSNADECIALTVRATEPVDISVGIEGGCICRTETAGGHLEAYGHCYANSPEESGNVIKYVGMAAFIGAVSSDGMRCEAEADGTGKRLCVREVTEATLIFTARSNYPEIKPFKFGDTSPDEALQADDDPDKAYIAKCGNELEKLEKQAIPSILKAMHIKEYSNYYNRVKLQLPQSSVIYETLFNYGRYLMISASRRGTQPANLQGIWNNMLTPPWNCNYTVNINTEMNYWLTGPCNLHEMSEPLLVMMEELCEEGRKTARDYYGVEGTCAFHNVNIWRKSGPATGNPMWNCWPLGSQWLCRNLFEECLFSDDYDYLVRTERVMRENLRFCVNIAVETPDGIALSPGTSPENEFWWRDDSPEIAMTGVHVNHPKTWDDWKALSDDGCRQVAVAYYSENENAVFRNLCRDYISCCEMLERHAAESGDNKACVYDRGLYERAREILPRIVPVRLDSKGRVMEWNEELPEHDVHHRHLSHLYELHPGCGITEQTPELFEAARKSLVGRGDEGTGWSLAWKLLMWARMKDGAHEEGLLDMFARPVTHEPGKYHGGGGVYANLFCAHPPFQIDGNYGFSAGIAEMLVQSHEDYIHILPALPPSWDKGSVSGLKVRGGITVDISWNAGKVSVDFTGAPGRRLRYRIGSGEIMTATT